jgi:hypothetical protein
MIYKYIRFINNHFQASIKIQSHFRAFSHRRKTFFILRGTFDKKVFDINKLKETLSLLNKSFEVPLKFYYELIRIYIIVSRNGNGDEESLKVLLNMTLTSMSKSTAEFNVMLDLESLAFIDESPYHNGRLYLVHRLLSLAMRRVEHNSRDGRVLIMSSPLNEILSILLNSLEDGNPLCKISAYILLHLTGDISAVLRGALRDAPCSSHLPPSKALCKEDAVFSSTVKKGRIAAPSKGSAFESLLVDVLLRLLFGDCCREMLTLPERGRAERLWKVTNYLHQLFPSHLLANRCRRRPAQYSTLKF